MSGFLSCSRDAGLQGCSPWRGIPSPMYSVSCLPTLHLNRNLFFFNPVRPSRYFVVPGLTCFRMYCVMFHAILTRRTIVSLLRTHYLVVLMEAHCFLRCSNCSLRMPRFEPTLVHVNGGIWWALDQTGFEADSNSGILSYIVEFIHFPDNWRPPWMCNHSMPTWAV